MQSTSKRILRFSFNGKKVKMKPTTLPEFSNNVAGVKSIFKNRFKSKRMKNLIDRALYVVEKKFEYVHIGRIK